MASKQSASQAIQGYLLSVKDAVAEIADPETGKPVQIPDFDVLYQAAGRLDDVKGPANHAIVIQSLLGRASSYGMRVPGPDYKMTFPKDHAFHPEMGQEWYWIGCNLNTVDSAGTKQRLGVLMIITKDRIVGRAAQDTAGWDDQDALIFSSTATIVFDDPAKGHIVRRKPNVQWPLLGGKASYSPPGATKFSVECGPDSFTGNVDVLPLQASINDGDNMKIDLNFQCTEGLNSGNAFFLEGVPKGLFFSADGKGITPLPTPGLYYSWPQVLVEGKVTVGGEEYEVQSGSSAWIDHQLMMSSLRNHGDVSAPVPFVDDPTPYNGWSWQFFNLESGDAFACSSFQMGGLNINPQIHYGYYLKIHDGAWKPYYLINGEMKLGNFREFPVDVNCKGNNCTSVIIPTQWSYEKLGSFTAALLFAPLQGVAYPWSKSGTFNMGLSITSEMPADYCDTSGKHSPGVGFCESVGFENVISYRNRALEFLGETDPCGS